MSTILSISFGIAFDAGIEEVLIITNRGKGAIEDHFDHAYELESKLKDNEGKKDIYNDVLACSKFGNIFFIRQKETKGLGHAVLCAKSFVGNEPFAWSKWSSIAPLPLLVK